MKVEKYQWFNLSMYIKMHHNIGITNLQSELFGKDVIGNHGVWLFYPLTNLKNVNFSA